MLTRLVDLNCKDSNYFRIEFEESNNQGISTDQELFDRWIRDLRSGKYKQVHETLYEPNNDTSYCALGVLCKKRIRRWRQKGDFENSRSSQDAIIDDILEHVSDYFTNILIYTDHGYRFDIFNFLIELNDYCKLSFITIADIMELIHNAIKGKDVSEFEIRLKNQSGWELSAI